PKDAGAKSDVYSAGVVLYEMLTGTLPFNSRSLPKLIDAVYRGDKPLPSALRPEVDKELEAIVLKAMTPRMNDRYESARAFFEALEEYNMRPQRSSSKNTAIVPDPPANREATPSQWTLVNVKSDANEKHPIQGESVMVGRDRTCAIVLAHPAVSRRHARITLAGESCMPEKLQS